MPSANPPGRFCMRARRVQIALSSLAVIAAGLTLTPSASADSVQFQSYQRASASEACSAQPGETPWEAAWGVDSSWHPTWEQWPNGGTGGWTCARSITWEKRTPLGCVQILFQRGPFPPFWVDFGSGFVAPPGSPLFLTADCAAPSSGPLSDEQAFVWATNTDAAAALCSAVLPGTQPRTPTDVDPANIYSCINPG